MGLVVTPDTVKLFSGFIFCRPSAFIKARAALIKKFGKIDFESEPLDFGYTDYYRDEFGVLLARKFISFAKLIDPGELSRIKLVTNSIENKLSSGRKRSVNIDPGYICLSKLVLATTKDFAHRIYLDRGIYAEVTLNWHGDTFVPHELTYPDYRSQAYIDIFNRIRKSYADGRNDRSRLQRSV